jgi:phosphatidylglycerophosphatase A
LKKTKQVLIKLSATGLGLGYIPFAPGTFGTVLGVLICLLFKEGGPWLYIVFTLIFIAASIGVSEAAEDIFGEHDSRKIVIDEIAGYLVTMIFIPSRLDLFIIGFVAFRFFDILKPFPVGYLDKKVKGGLGVVLDDVAAGVYANLTLWGYILIRGLIER